MKFLADMGISPKTVAYLIGVGHDAVHLHDQALDQLPDSEILGKALDEKRVVLTHDLGFGDLLAANRFHLPSVIIFRLRNMQPDNVHLHLKKILEQYRGELEAGAVISVTEGHVRLRVLPIADS